MSKTIKIALSLLAVSVLSALAFYYFKGNRNIGNEQVQIETPSIKGCYVAKLAKDVYTLVIESQDGENVSGRIAYNNYQKDSSSGSFAGTFSGNILTGNYSFDSEGSHSDRQMIFKKDGDSFIQGFGPVTVVGGKESFVGNEIAYDSESTFVKSESCTNLFTEDNNTFSFSYNPYFFAYEAEEKVLSNEWSLNSNQKGIVLTNVVIPRTFLPGTNFSDARFTVGRSTEPNAIKNCTTDTTNGISTGEEKIGGYKFTKFEFMGAAAGNLYETTGYKAIVDGDCYAIEYTIHSSNIGNYPPDQGVREFNKNKIKEEFDKTIQSFKFIINSD